jgi:glycosyltransferase involved in cell wall biosynthesis
MGIKTPPRPYVLYVHEAEHIGGCEAYRMMLPADTLRLRDKVVDYVRSRKLAERVQEQGLRVIDAYDIFVLPRSGFRHSGVAELAKRRGVKFVLEVDDDFTGRYREVVDRQTYDAIWRFARGPADAVLCSTPYLADLMHQEIGKPAWVLPNSVNLAAWRVPKRARLTIALTGSNTHGADWAVLGDVLSDIMAKYPQVDLMVGGFLPDYLSDIRTAYPKRTIWNEWVPFSRYPATVGSAHIVLCPVDPEDGFNRSKSGLKAIEGMAAQAAVIATDMNIYRDVIDHGRTGLLVPHTADAWHAAIVRLIEDPDTRSALAARGRTHVARHHNIFANADLWWKAFRKIKEL